MQRKGKRTQFRSVLFRCKQYGILRFQPTEPFLYSFNVPFGETVMVLEGYYSLDAAYAVKIFHYMAVVGYCRKQNHAFVFYVGCFCPVCYKIRFFVYYIGEENLLIVVWFQSCDEVTLLFRSQRRAFCHHYVVSPFVVEGIFPEPSERHNAVLEERSVVFREQYVQVPSDISVLKSVVEQYEVYFREAGSLKNRMTRYIKSNIGNSNAFAKLEKILNEYSFIGVKDFFKTTDINTLPSFHL